MQLREEHPPGCKHIIIQVLHKEKTSREQKQEGSPQAANLQNRKTRQVFHKKRKKKRKKQLELTDETKINLH